MTKPVFEDLIQPLIREKNQESSVILYPTGTNAEWTKLVVGKSSIHRSSSGGGSRVSCLDSKPFVTVL